MEYSYTVKINGDKLTVSFDKRLAFASVGAYVFNTIPSKTNAPDHFANTVTVDLPEGYGETVYLYTHLQNLGWYAVDDKGDFVWQFKGWRYDDNRTEYDDDYELIDTAYGEYALDDTVYGDYTLADTQYGEYELKDTVYGEYKLDHTVYGEYELGHTEYGDYILAETKDEDRRVADAYTGTLALTVDGEPADLDAKLTLRPGEHTFVLTGDGIAAKTEKVTVQAGKTAQVNFGTQDCRYADEILDVVEHNADQLATRHEADLTATRHEDDKDTENHFSDCEATRHEADLAAEKHDEDQEAEKIYEDAYLWKPDVKLGSETDANSEYAVKE